MNSMERVMATVSGQTPDRQAVAPQVFAFAAHQFGVGIGRYVRDGAVLAKCQLKCRERFGTDAVFAISDVNVESEAAGSELVYREGEYPTIGEHVLHSAVGIDGLAEPDPERDGRMPELLAAVRTLRASVKDTCPVVGCVLGPMTLAVQLMGAEKALFLSHDDPQAFQALLEHSTAIAERYGAAQLQAGAHAVLVLDLAATPTLFPSRSFISHEEAQIARIFAALKKEGNAANWLHVPGRTGPILEHIRAAGTQILGIDQSVTLLEVQEHLPGVCVLGNINCLSLLQEGPALIKADCDRLLDEYSVRRGLILSSACEVPPLAPGANIMAMVHSARDRK
jgi:uroporphyrinogen decarboxylase